MIHSIHSTPSPEVCTDYEIIWFQQSGGRYTVDFQDYPIVANMLFFLLPGQIHHLSGPSHFQGFRICIPPERMHQMAVESESMAGSIFYSVTNLPYVFLDTEAADRLEHTLRRIIDEQSVSQSYAHSEMMRMLLGILLIDIQRAVLRPRIADTEDMPASLRLVVRFRSMIEEEYMHLHKVSEYAERLGVSTKTLTVAVRESTGSTPLTLINDRLILESRRLLRFSDLRVKEIAYRLGFVDPSNFVKFFKHYTGTLPQISRCDPSPSNIG